MMTKCFLLCLASALASVTVATIVQHGSGGSSSSGSSYSYSLNMTYYIDSQGCHVSNRLYSFGTQFPLDVQGPCFWFLCSYMQLTLINQDFQSCMIPGRSTCAAIGSTFTVPGIAGTCRCDNIFRLICTN